MVGTEKPLQQYSWCDRIKAGLAAHVDPGGTHYGYRKDRVYNARTRSAEQIVTPGARHNASPSSEDRKARQTP